MAEPIKSITATIDKQRAVIEAQKKASEELKKQQAQAATTQKA